MIVRFEEVEEGESFFFKFVSYVKECSFAATSEYGETEIFNGREIVEVELDCEDFVEEFL